MNEPDFFHKLMNVLDSGHGFSADNLAEIARHIAHERKFSEPAAALVLLHTCEFVASYWDGPVTYSQATIIRHAFEGRIRQLLTSLANQDSDKTRVATSDLAAAVLQPPTLP